MTDYRKEAERLADAIVREVAELPDRDSPADWPAAMLVTSDELRGIVLAHIQRGAVPEGYVAVPRFLAENHRNLTDVPRYQRILDDCLAAAPDQFRDAAKMRAVQPSCMTCGGHGMVGGLLPNGGGYEADSCPDCTAPAAAAPDNFRDAAGMVGEPAKVPMPQVRWATCPETDTPCSHCPTKRIPCQAMTAPAEVPMPEPDTSDISGYTPHALRTYGAACRAAGEAAGYARGLADAGRDAEAFRAAVRLGLCVNCYTSSDCMADGSAAVEIYASEIADSIHVKAIPDPYAAARSAVFAAANQIDALRGEVKP